MEYLQLEDTLKLVSELNEKNLERYINTHRLNQMIILFCLDGSMKITIYDQTFQIESSSLITICPDLEVKLEDLTDNFRCYVITVRRDLLNKAFYVKHVSSIEDILFHSPIVQLDENGRALLVHYFSFLTQIYEKLNGNHPEIIKCHLMSLLMSLNAIYRGRDCESDTEVLSRSKIICHDFINLVRNHHAEEHQLKFYADKLFITPKHLMSVIKKHLGKNPKTLIDEAIIADAKFQLKTTDLCIKQICDMLNFPNPSFFGKFFKQHVGVSPNAYRNGVNKISRKTKH